MGEGPEAPGAWRPYLLPASVPARWSGGSAPLFRPGRGNREGGEGGEEAAEGGGEGGVEGLEACDERVLAVGCGAGGAVGEEIVEAAHEECFRSVLAHRIARYGELLVKNKACLSAAAGP